MYSFQKNEEKMRQVKATLGKGAQFDAADVFGSMRNRRYKRRRERDWDGGDSGGFGGGRGGFS